MAMTSWFTEPDDEMTALKKFDFNDSFELKNNASEDQDGVRYAEIYGRAELDVARDEGMRDGAAQERATTERLQAEALAAISERLAAIAQQQAAALENVSQEAVALAMAIARKVAPSLMRQQPTAEIEGMIADFLQQLIDEPRIVVRAPDALLEGLKGRIDEIAAGCGFAGNVVFLADPALGAGDCTLEWADGGAERQVDAIWRDIDTRLGTASGGQDCPAIATPTAAEPAPTDGS